MSDLISRQTAIDAVYHKCTNIFVNNLPVMTDKADVYKVLKEIPSAQPDVVHCRECVHADKHFHCSYMNTWNPDGFCHCGYAKRK